MRYFSGKELVEYCFFICYFNVTKLYSEKQATSGYLEHFHGIGNKHQQFLMSSWSKRLRMRNWDTILGVHGRVDKTMYGAP